MSTFTYETDTAAYEVEFDLYAREQLSVESVRVDGAEVEPSPVLLAEIEEALWTWLREEWREDREERAAGGWL